MGIYKDILADNLRRRLAELDRRPAWVSVKAGVAKSVLSQILSGDANPSLETITAISNALETSLGALLTPPAETTIQTARGAFAVSELVAKFRSVSPERQMMALAFLFDDPSLAPDDLENESFLKLLKSR